MGNGLTEVFQYIGRATLVELGGSAPTRPIVHRAIVPRGRRANKCVCGQHGSTDDLVRRGEIGGVDWQKPIAQAWGRHNIGPSVAQRGLLAARQRHIVGRLDESAVAHAISSGVGRASLLCLFTLACSKPSVALVSDAANVSVSDAADASDSAAPPSDEPVPAPAGEAMRRDAVALGDPALASIQGALTTHFDKPPAQLDLQTASCARDRRALLVSASKQRNASSPMPLLALVGRDDHVLWFKDMALGGISPPVRFPTVTANDRASVTLVAYDPPTKIVMARVWDEDGAPFADFTLLEGVQCDALSAAYWPGHGVLVVASTPAGSREQLLGNDGRNAFSTRGELVGGAWRATAPASIVIDSPDTVMLAMHASHYKSDAIAIYRYDDQARMKWADPVMIDVSTIANTSSRIEASLASPGVARVETEGATFGKAVRVESSGAFVRVTK